MYGTFLESALKGLSNDGLVNTNERKLQKLYHGLRHGWYLMCVCVHVCPGWGSSFSATTRNHSTNRDLFGRPE